MLTSNTNSPYLTVEMNHDGLTDPLPREETVEQLSQSSTNEQSQEEDLEVSSQIDILDELLFKVMILRDICYDLIDEDLRRRKYENRSDQTEKCVICLNKLKYSDEATKLKCGHLFHIECIKKWVMVENMCPLCKQAVVGSDSEDDGEEFGEEEDEEIACD